MGVLAPKGQSRCLCRSESKAQFPDLFLSCTRSLGSECRSCSGRALLRLRLGLRLTDGGFIEILAALVYSVSPDVRSSLPTRALAPGNAASAAGESLRRFVS